MAAATHKPNNAHLPQFLKQSRAELHNKFVDLEWQQRNRLLEGTQKSGQNGESPSQWSRLDSEVVMNRNRYMNVEPFAQNRIKLKVAEGVYDYINASPIQLGKRRYIATQGPKDTSVNHFYRMVTNELQSPAVVVMLTQTHEAGKEKCFQYYPLSKEESPLIIQQDELIGDGFEGAVELVDVKADETTRSELRTLKVRTRSQDEQSRETEIRHLLFSGWPDFLVPEGEDRNALVQLVRLSAALNQPASSNTDTKTNGSSFAADLASTDEENPRIIHCSAGVGRSGTFIALDYLLSLMFSGQLDNLPEGSDPIAETVDRLRQQRMMMVQGESQFNFLYEVMREQMAARAQNGGTDAVAGAMQNGRP
ncbi:hypothetical protein DOTSEDRAFT_178713 [Dothistroma septosporum NZE10]|uniref:Uncharacterized protein n=1 Tax=Dothistroma septosporum (strain NZE10 / CBS 128990) TaxID=675120 RepID=N1PEZ9_DOTSN|nr:hypothetical protein DOTSEDRAFT_178713 [Dothistroma septosporum NZE10]